MYRVVPAELYLRYFASDRTHHPRRIDGAWSKAPAPELPCIVTGQGWKNSMHRWTLWVDLSGSTDLTGSGRIWPDLAGSDRT